MPLKGFLGPSSNRSALTRIQRHRGYHSIFSVDLQVGILVFLNISFDFLHKDFFIRQIFLCLTYNADFGIAFSLIL